MYFLFVLVIAQKLETLPVSGKYFHILGLGGNSINGDNGSKMCLKNNVNPTL